MFQLSPEQILILGTVASMLVFVFRLAAEFFAKQKITLPIWVNNLIVFAIALVFGLIWMPAAFPPLPVPSGDPGTDVHVYLIYLGNILAVLTGALSFAVFIYQYLIVKVKPAARRLLKIR